MKISKNIVIAAVVLVAVAIGSIVLMNNKDSNNNVASQNKTEEHNSNDHAVEKGNIFSLTDMDHAHKCTFTYSGDNGTSNGTMYADGKGNGLMQMDIKTSAGNTGKSNTLLKGNDVYGWTEVNGITAAGFKYSKATLSSQSSSASSNSNSTVDPDQKFDLACNSWDVDENVFSVPSNIQFMSLPTNQ